MGKEKTWIVNGVEGLTSYWAKECGVSTSNMKHYFDKYSPEEAVEKASRKDKKTGVAGRLITYNGETMNLTEWSKRIGINRKVISDRLQKGYSIEEALSPQKWKVGSRNPKLGRRDLAEKKKSGQYDTWVDSIEKRLEQMDDNKDKTYIKVRWCDRTSHSHSWHDTMVERRELQTFLDTHYLAKVVVQW